jgi:lysozyme
MLPPVVDLEHYGGFRANPPDATAVTTELRDCLEALEAAYGTRPIIYLDADAYTRYVENRLDYPLWIRDIWGTPALPEGKPWLFWQYSSRGELTGYNGTEPFIDLNVFNGTSEDLAQLGPK